MHKPFVLCVLLSGACVSAPESDPATPAETTAAPAAAPSTTTGPAPRPRATAIPADVSELPEVRYYMVADT